MEYVNPCESNNYDVERELTKRLTDQGLRDAYSKALAAKEAVYPAYLKALSDEYQSRNMEPR